MLDPVAIRQQHELIATHRRTLAHLLQQAAQYGGKVFAPPQVAQGIDTVREEIRAIKVSLRVNGLEIEDQPNDEPHQHEHNGEKSPTLWAKTYQTSVGESSTIDIIHDPSTSQAQVTT